MPFGIKSAPEIFQQRMHQALENLEGVTVIADDILLFGKGKDMEEAMKDHNEKLEALFNRCREKNIKLNKEKLKLMQTETLYMGHVIS